MYKIENAEICAALDSESRSFRAILDFGNFVIADENVGRISINGGSVRDELPCIGDVVSAQAEIIVMKLPDTAIEGKEFQLYIYCISPTGFDPQKTTHKQLAGVSHKLLSKFTHREIAELGEKLCGLPFLPIPMGKFTVLKCRRGSDYYTLTCCDRLHFADKNYRPNITIPATSNVVANDICNQLSAGHDLTEGAAAYLAESAGKFLTDKSGRRLMLSTWQFDITSIPPKTTMRQMLSYIGAMTGNFVVCDRFGTIVRRWYLEDGARKFVPETDGSSDGSNCRISEINTGEGAISLTKLVCKTDGEKSVSVGSGREMEFECPYMSEERLRQIYNCARIMAYLPAEMTQQLGDPRLDPWDGWKYTADGTEYTLLMLNMQTVCDGGLMLEISSGGDTDTEYSL